MAVRASVRPFALAALLVAGPASAQFVNRGNAPQTDSFRSSKTTRQSLAGRGEFPSWEREVSADEFDPLPEAATGRHVEAFSLEVGHVPRGVAALGDGTFAVAMADGVVQWRSREGELEDEVDVGAAIQHVPVPVGSRVLVAGADFLALVGRSGVAWRATLAAAPSSTPVVRRASVYVVTPQGIESRVLETGAIAWSAPVAGVSTAPALGESELFVGTSTGEVVALDETGRELWREIVAERLDGLATDGDSIYAAGFGKSARSRKDRGPIALRLTLPAKGGRAGKVAWVLRLGGPCNAAPFFLDQLVAFPSADGYVHAVERRRGIEGWRTDLPARCRVPPAWSGGRLDFALGPSRYLISIAAENGAVMGWSALKDEDDFFVGRPQSVGLLTVVATRLERVVGYRWERDAEETGTTAEREPPVLQAISVGDVP